MTNFLKSESGAITVDWVVLTAGLVGLGIAVMSLVTTSVDNATDRITQTIDAAGVTTAFP